MTLSGSKTATGAPEPPPVLVRRLTEADHAAWLSMRQALWMGTDSTTRGAQDLTLFIEPERFGAIRYEALVALVGERPVGFVEVSLRDDLEAFGRVPVGYVEGIFVEIGDRGIGVGRTLLGAAEAWTRSAGASELVSDVIGDNPDSLAFHRATGFAVVQETDAGGRRHVLLARRL
jgi:GNAT superfamily N-acetyltransferase